MTDIVQPSPKAFRRPVIDGWTLATAAIAGVIAVPIFVVLSYLLVPTGDIWRHLASTVLPRYVGNTLWLMVGVGTGTLVIGAGTAWLVTLYRFPGRDVLQWALFLPMAVPGYIIAYTYGGLMDFAGPVQSGLRAMLGWGRNDYWFPHIRSLGGATALLTLVLYPYVYLLARAAFTEQSVCVLEASRTLGAGPWRRFFRIGLPLARPALVAGVALALMETLNDLGAMQHLAVDTFTTGIFRTWLGMGQPAAAAQLAAVLLVFVIVLLVLERWSRGGARYHQTSSRYRALPSLRLKGIKAGLAVAACMMPILLGFAIPLGVLIWWAIRSQALGFNARFVTLTVNTVSLGLLAAFLAVLLSLVLAYGTRLRPTPMVRGLTRLASVGYAVPGAVIAVGVMLPFATIDRTIDAWAKAAFGISTGLVLSGTVVAVTFAYLVRFLAISFNAAEASLAKVGRSMDDAGRVLGRHPREILTQIHLPLVRPSLLAAALLVFVDVIKELPATLILRPFNFDTLAIYAYDLARNEQLAEAAAPALAILVAGLGPVILLARSIGRSRPGHIS
ncbi:MAG: iron ABC transporter permease [Alphaproteobacteria bacterium]|nr:iron ABC transporter permease [Alphaproteobacteria bacterium]